VVWMALCPKKNDALFHAFYPSLDHHALNPNQSYYLEGSNAVPFRESRIVAAPV
jgi:hypothetical protein